MPCVEMALCNGLMLLLVMKPDTFHTFNFLVLTLQPGLFGHVKGKSYNPLEEDLSRSF